MINADALLRHYAVLARMHCTLSACQTAHTSQQDSAFLFPAREGSDACAGRLTSLDSFGMVKHVKGVIWTHGATAAYSYIEKNNGIPRHTFLKAPATQDLEKPEQQPE